MGVVSVPTKRYCFFMIERLGKGGKRRESGKRLKDAVDKTAGEERKRNETKRTDLFKTPGKNAVSLFIRSGSVIARYFIFCSTRILFNLISIMTSNRSHMNRFAQ